MKYESIIFDVDGTLWDSRALIAEGYNIEYYSNPEDFTNGMQDPEYYAEVWIPVKEK